MFFVMIQSLIKKKKFKRENQLLINKRSEQVALTGDLLEEISDVVGVLLDLDLHLKLHVGNVFPQSVAVLVDENVAGRVILIHGEHKRVPARLIGLGIGVEDNQIALVRGVVGVGLLLLVGLSLSHDLAMNAHPIELEF